LKLRKDVPISPAHFKCSVLEEALMKMAEAEGAPRLKPEAGRKRHRTGRRTSAEARGVFGYPSESGGRLPRDTDVHLQDELMSAPGVDRISWIYGETGVGKSRRTPLAVLGRLEQPKGVVHVLPRKLPAWSLLKFYEEFDDEVVKKMASIWNGDVQHKPTQREFVVLSTPVSFFHLLRSAASWQDLSVIVFDEIQVKNGLVGLLIVYVLDKILRDEDCARGVRV